jgi:hypothetical protein
MARYLIQSGRNFQFLHSCPHTGDVAWTPSLALALRNGVIDDEEQVAQMLEDHCDKGTCTVVDLDDSGD